MKPTRTYEPNSLVSKIEWWHETKILTVTLTNGRTYRYADVPREACDEFLAAKSAGQFFTRRIKPNFKLVEG